MKNNFDCDFQPTAQAFISAIPQDFDCEISVSWRKKEIEEAKNKKVKREKTFVWALLEHAVKEVFGKNIEEYSPKKDASGKICADGIFVSVSHSGNYALVAVAKNKIGCDIEERKDKDFTHLVEKFATENEKKLFNEEKDKNTCFYKLWTAKEAVYKQSCENVFAPDKTEVGGNNIDYFITENFVAAVAFDGKTQFDFLRCENGKFFE